jgi:tetratricopeptide (TPR) repeat protein
MRLLGRSLVMRSGLDAAEAVLRSALALRPDFPPLYEDLGGVLALQGRFEEAIENYREGLKRDPELPFAGKKLGQALAALGRGPQADKAFEDWFERDPDRVYVAVALDHLAARRTEAAITTLRRALRANPDNVDALYALSQAYWGDEQRRPDVEAMLRRATDLAPGHTPAWILLGTLLHDSDRPTEALACLDRAVAQDPKNAVAWSSLGAALVRVSDLDRSVEAYERSLALDGRRAGIHMSLAHSLKTLGRQDEALRAYRSAISLQPDFGEAYWSMANLKVFRFEPEEVAAMEKQVARQDLSPSAAVHFRFALGKAYEDAGEYDKAWESYRSGNDRQRPLVSYDPVGFEARHDEIITVFNRDFLEQHADEGHDSDAPIFIVGMPRSGSTLIEQILASHSQVEGTLELSTLADLAVSTGRYRRADQDYPFAVRELQARDFVDYGRKYIEDTQVVRRTDRPRFTDKLPNNFSHIGFAHLILPKARIINARRHPLDTCLGCYKQLFAKGQNFTYDANELALYYRVYHDTIKHWHRVLPGKVLDVHYEETVGDFEAQVRRILDHCGLPFEEACLRFHETQRPIRTASSEQVRQPLHARALGTWRRYASHLEPWMRELEDVIAELPVSVRNSGLQ